MLLTLSQLSHEPLKVVLRNLLLEPSLSQIQTDEQVYFQMAKDREEAKPLLGEQAVDAPARMAEIEYQDPLEPRAELHILSSEHRHLGYYEPSSVSPFPIRSAQKKMEDRMIDTLGLNAAHRVLNVGCGTGLTACRLVEKSYVTVTAIDTDPNHVKETIKNINRRHVGARMAVSESGYQNLEFWDNSFHGVCGLECFDHAIDPSLAIREFARVLKPGGRLVLHTVIDVVNRDYEKEPHKHGMITVMVMDSPALLHFDLPTYLPTSLPPPTKISPSL